MADPSRYVTNAETKLRKIVENLMEIKSLAQELDFRIARLGGVQFTQPHFMTEDENGDPIPRTDLNYSYDEFATVISNMGTLGAYIPNNVYAVLMKITG